MSVFEIKEDYSFAECMPFSLYRDGVPILAIVGDGEPLAVATATDRALAEHVRAALGSADDLARIRDAVKAHDDKMNDEDQWRGPQSPTGDDYNHIHSLIMNGAPSAPKTTAHNDPDAPAAAGQLTAFLCIGMYDDGSRFAETVGAADAADAEEIAKLAWPEIELWAGFVALRDGVMTVEG